MQLALEPIWKAYEACSPGADAAALLGKIVKALQLTRVSLIPFHLTSSPVAFKRMSGITPLMSCISSMFCICLVHIHASRYDYSLSSPSARLSCV